ncbi:MAG: uracil-DNA glycosylase [Alphaproteobacteria bacterium]|nr:uracil-DNA glycosylase [Alphaproteobacteria bacterium]
MENAQNILSWYITAGIETICGDEPYNALQKNETSENVGQTINMPKTVENIGKTNVRPATTLLAQENSAACANAKELCTKAQTLEDLKAIMENFTGCSLKFSANSTVFGSGNPQAEIMLIGEAPGADEDRMGEPFVGRSGQLLNKMLAAISVKREDCYITNVLPWRPPGNRTPTDAETAVCLPFLHRQIELIKPKIIFLLGASAANAVLGKADSISDMRGHFIEYTLPNGDSIPTLAGYHPAFLLRSPAQKAKAWSDLMRLQRKLEDL